MIQTLWISTLKNIFTPKQPSLLTVYSFIVLYKIANNFLILHLMGLDGATQFKIFPFSVPDDSDLTRLLLTLPSSSCRTPSPAPSSSSLEGPSPVPLTCFPGAAAAAQAFIRRATGGQHPPRMCLAWRGCWKRGPSLSFPQASTPLPPGPKDLLTHMSLYSPFSLDPAWVFGGSATSGGRSMLRSVDNITKITIKRLILFMELWH